MITKEYIQLKKKELTERFIEKEKQRQAALALADKCTQELLEISGGVKQLIEIEKELDNKTLEKQA